MWLWLAIICNDRQTIIIIIIIKVETYFLLKGSFLFSFRNIIFIKLTLPRKLHKHVLSLNEATEEDDRRNKQLLRKKTTWGAHNNK